MKRLLTIGAALTLPWVGLAPANAEEPETTTRPGAGSTGSTDSSAGQVKAPIPKLVWKKCPGEMAENQCADAKVPLDYDEPDGPTTTIKMLKAPAKDQKNKIGSLFVNPGGPGGSAVDFAAGFASTQDPEVGRRFDVIGIEPRGVSPATECRATTGAPRSFDGSFPANRKQRETTIRFNAWAAKACATGANAITGHMSTADTARDMDLIRQAVGDEKLTYFGISYGSMLGSTYASMFPDRVRALVVDGVLDPNAWSKGSGPSTVRINSGAGSFRSWRAALRECNKVSRKKCAFTGGGTVRKWDRLVQRLRKGPVTIKGEKLDYATLISVAISAMYNRSSIPTAMQVTDTTYKATFGTKKQKTALTREQLRPELPRSPLPGPYGGFSGGFAGTDDGTPVRAANEGAVSGNRTFSDPFTGVLCADTDNPGDPRAWIGASARQERLFQGFGQHWTWASNTCATWPKSTQEDRFTGPYGGRTSTPLLVTSTNWDPATPFSGARATHKLFDESHLVSTMTWGHGAMQTGKCINRVYRNYFVDQKLPAGRSSTCRPTKKLF